MTTSAFLGKEELQYQLGREPTLTELAESMGVEKEELVQAMEANTEIDSLQKTIYQQDGSQIQLMDKLVEENAQEERVLNHMLLGELLGLLKGEERQLLYLRYFAEKTQAEVGECLGISQVQVSRLEKKILKQLREVIL